MAAIANWLFMSRNGVHMPRSAWRRHMTNFSNSSAGISPLYPAALKRSADGPRIAPDRPKHNHTVQVVHNFNEIVENDSRNACKMRHIKVHASSAGITLYCIEIEEPLLWPSKTVGGRAGELMLRYPQAHNRHPETPLSRPGQRSGGAASSPPPCRLTLPRGSMAMQRTSPPGSTCGPGAVLLFLLR